MRLRAEYRVGPELRFLSNLDFMHLIERALRRAALPFALSSGFNPHIKLSMGTVLPVGVWGEREYFDLDLHEYVCPEEFTTRINFALPPGVEVKRAVPIDLSTPSLMKVINAASYVLILSRVNYSLSAFFENLLNQPALIVKSKGKKKDLDKDLRSGIYRIDVEECEEVNRVHIWVAVGEPLNVRYDELLTLLQAYGLERSSLIDIFRSGNYIYQASEFLSPLEKVE